MNESGWKLAGREPEPEPIETSAPKSGGPWLYVLLALVLVAVGAALLIILKQSSDEPIAQSEAEIEVVDGNVAEDIYEAAVVGSLSKPLDEAAGNRALVSEIVRLRNEVQQLRNENSELRTKLAQQDVAISYVTGGGNAPGDGSPLITRAFNLNVASVLALAEPQATAREASAKMALQKLFARAGARFEPPASVKFGEGLNQLMVHSTSSDVAAVEQTLTSLGLLAPDSP